MKRVVTELFNNHIGVENSEVPDPAATQSLRQFNPEAEVVTQPLWTIVFTDRDTGEQIRVGLTRKGRDGLIKDLTGGIVLAGGELPSL